MALTTPAWRRITANALTADAEGEYRPVASQRTTEQRTTERLATGSVSPRVADTLGAPRAPGA
eukprot:14458734-Heterocapsa_arctica.AAC.1